MKPGTMPAGVVAAGIIFDLDGVLIAVVWMWRGQAIRIITMRKARDGEKRRYQALYG